MKVKSNVKAGVVSVTLTLEQSAETHSKTHIGVSVAPDPR